MSRLINQAANILLKTRVPLARTSGKYVAFGLRAASSSSPSDTDFKPSEELAKERYDSRANEDIEKKRARLLYQSRKRGMLENGVILSSFANKFLHKLDADHLDQYDQLINLPTNDWDIFYWATKTKPTPPEFETPVMAMLREHLHSKVSNKSNDLPELARLMGKTRGEDIIMPAFRPNIDFDVDLDKISLVEYKEQLFDDRVKKVGGKQYNMMTNWRKRHFERRLRRKISSPTSLEALSDERENEVFTQKNEGKKFLDEYLVPNNRLDSVYESKIKHHHLMQHMLSNNLADDALDYDDEAEAWADMIWHRNYGSHNHKIAIAKDLSCNKCNSRLHCSDPGLQGYMPQELFTRLAFGSDDKANPVEMTCQRCRFSATYDANLSKTLTPQEYEQFLLALRHDRSISVVILLFDLTDFPGSIWEGVMDLIGNKSHVIVVGNKVDLLPIDGPKFLPRLMYGIHKNLDRLRPGQMQRYVRDTLAISARTGFGIESLVTRLLDYCESPQNVYMIGNSNTGKSTLFNALLQTDLCATRKCDIISRVAKYRCPETNFIMLKFPIEWAEGWEIEMRKRRAVMVERNHPKFERTLESSTKHRQESMPHMSMLINRLSYPAPSANLYCTSTTGALTPTNGRDLLVGDNIGEPKFSADHPLANMVEPEPVSATEEKFPDEGFLHCTPSASHPDQLHNLLTQEERIEVFHHDETLVPRKYSLRPLQTIFIAGLARLDLLTSQENVIFTIYASKYLPIHVVPSRDADKFYHSCIGTAYLGVPRGGHARLATWPDLMSPPEDFHIRGLARGMIAADVVFSSIGWASVSTIQDQECIVRAYTPEARGIFLRNPALLSRANSWHLGRKIRDTPMFEHPDFSIERRKLRDTQRTTMA